MDLLRRFNGDKATKEILLEFIRASIEKQAIKRIYDREDVSHIADAKELIEKAFEELEEMFILKKEQNEYVNEAK